MVTRRPSLGLPEVLILYVRPDDEGHLCGAKRQKDNTWLYTEFTVIPASDGATGFIKDATTNEGYIAFDCREAAKQQNPGMESATPVILYRSQQVSLKDAVEGSAQLQRAIINSPD